MSRMGAYYEEMKENGNWSEADEYYKSMWDDKEEGPISETTDEGVITNLSKLRKSLIKKGLQHKTKDGETICITDMTDSHLNNLIRYYETKKALLHVDMPDIDTHAWDDANEVPFEFVPLKDSSLYCSIKYDLLLKEKKRRR